MTVGVQRFAVLLASEEAASLANASGGDQEDATPQASKMT